MTDTDGSTAPEGGGGYLAPFVLLQHLLPQHALSRLVHAAARSRAPRFKNLLISAFVRGFRPDLADAERPDPLAYESFNAFFTRALRPGARPVAQAPDAIASPVDGTISALGGIDGNQLLQAKGRHYTLDALLAGRDDWVRRFRGGSFATIYLAPYDYHRMHMAVPGVLRETWYVPGRLFSVNRRTVDGVANLFARNERVMCFYEHGDLSHALVMVGALNVGSIETPWHGEIAPRRPRRLSRIAPAPAAPPLQLERGDETGRFNMGSTVILLFPPGRAAWRDDLQAGQVVRMGEAIGRLLPEP